MIEKITDQNLERYDSRLKEWCDRKFFEKGNYGKYQTTEEAGAVAFYPVPDTPLEGKVKFSFKETMPAEGVKGPDNPSTIIGIESVSINRAGKNLFNFGNYSFTKDNVTVTVDSNGIVTFNGTSSASNGVNTEFSVYNRNIHVPAGKKLSISYQELSGTATPPQGYSFYIACQCSLFKGYENKTYFAAYNTVSNKSTMLLNDDNFIRALTVKASGGTVYDNYKFKPQLEISDECTDYEPPVLDTFTISFNDTYYGGEIDFATGVMTVTVGTTVLDENYNFGTNSGYLIEYSNFYAIIFYPGHRPYGMGYNIPLTFVSNRLPIEYKSGNAVPTQNSLLLASNSRSMKLCLSKSELSLGDGESITTVRTAMLQWLSTHPVTITCPLETPITVQLDPVSIFTLTQTNKYTPRLNTVYTDADSVQISYLKSPIRDEYEKTQAILSLGGNS